VLQGSCLVIRYHKGCCKERCLGALELSWSVKVQTLFPLHLYRQLTVLTLKSFRPIN